MIDAIQSDGTLFGAIRKAIIATNASGPDVVALVCPVGMADFFDGISTRASQFKRLPNGYELCKHFLSEHKDCPPDNLLLVTSVGIAASMVITDKVRGELEDGRAIN